ncbi:hypothetical protein EVAR_75655_1 [Eumeta japonica]|uniref:Uncharacterized protein n=1 Tax=Eumeta variegata TaxID=151549 RepID=A0A4C1U022_EUMVA|nr:hypothetical protein EVAR_75655_1 [Eumeta japonica]
MVIYTRNLSGVTSALPASCEGIVYPMRAIGLMEAGKREWATRTLTHWTENNSDLAQFSRVGIIASARWGQSVIFRRQWPRAYRTASTGKGASLTVDAKRRTAPALKSKELRFEFPSARAVLMSYVCSNCVVFRGERGSLA